MRCQCQPYSYRYLLAPFPPLDSTLKSRPVLIHCISYHSTYQCTYHANNTVQGTEYNAIVPVMHHRHSLSHWEVEGSQRAALSAPVSGHGAYLIGSGIWRVSFVALWGPAALWSQREYPVVSWVQEKILIFKPFVACRGSRLGVRDSIHVQ